MSFRSLGGIHTAQTKQQICAAQSTSVHTDRARAIKHSADHITLSLLFHLDGNHCNSRALRWRLTCAGDKRPDMSDTGSLALHLPILSLLRR